MTGEEILDAGVQVIAQPRARRIRPSTCSRGGERRSPPSPWCSRCSSLNPAPFCLLDGSMRPLDDTPTPRFCGMVKKMSANPVPIYFHNKISMEMAEQLVGVTMQESGVSAWWKQISRKPANEGMRRNDRTPDGLIGLGGGNGGRRPVLAKWQEYRHRKLAEAMRKSQHDDVLLGDLVPPSGLVDGEGKGAAARAKTAEPVLADNRRPDPGEPCSVAAPEDGEPVKVKVALVEDCDDVAEVAGWRGVLASTRPAARIIVAWNWSNSSGEQITQSQRLVFERIAGQALGRLQTTAAGSGAHRLIPRQPYRRLRGRPATGGPPGPPRRRRPGPVYRRHAGTG